MSLSPTPYPPPASPRNSGSIAATVLHYAGVDFDEMILKVKGNHTRPAIEKDLPK